MYYEVVEESKYYIQVKGIEDISEVGDAFYTYEEIQDLTGEDYFNHHRRIIYFESRIEKELEKWAALLEASGKKTLLIKDPELVEFLKSSSNSLASYAGAKYTRRGDRIGYYRKRKKTKPTKGDLRCIWWAFEGGFRRKHGAYFPNIPAWARSLALFKALQKVVGWREVRKGLADEDAKWCKMIWNNPEEYI